MTYEARGSGCVLLVSDAAGAVCDPGSDGLVHAAGDVATLAGHMSLLHENRPLLEKLRAASLRGAPEITWRAAGTRLLEVYRHTMDEADRPTITEARGCPV